MSPTSADRLTAKSTADETKSAISSCISQMSHEHPDWEHDRVVAACHEMARSAVGKSKFPFLKR